MAAYGRVWQEFKRTWIIWVLLNFSGGMKALVNHVEQPFARSLVACEEPIVVGNYTGSQWCGDRLQVIGEGYRLSQRGQAQESFAMLCSLSFVAVAISAFGRRFCILLGLGGTLASVVLFVLASSSPERGRMLFATGQGLQGLYPVEYVFNIVLLDLSTRIGGDSEATFDIKTYEAIIGTIIFQALGFSVQVMELTDYSGLWFKIMLFTSSIFIAAVVFLPETQAFSGKEDEAAKRKDDDKKVENTAEKTPAQKLVNEIKNYAMLFKDFRCRRFLSMRFAQNIVSTFLFGGVPSFLMAYHGWSQSGLLLFMVVLLPIAIGCMPLFDKVVERFGYHDAYCGTICYFLGSMMAIFFALPLSDLLAMLFFFMMLPMVGYSSLQGVVDSRFCEKDDLARFTTMQWIMGLWQGVFVGPIFAWSFDAKATTYLERAFPCLFGVTALCVQLAIIFFGIYDMNGLEGFGITVRQMDQIRAKHTRLAALLRAGAEERRPRPEKAAEAADAEAEPLVTQAIWTDAGLQAAFERDLDKCEGPFKDALALRKFVEGLNTGPSEARKLLKTLDQALTSAEAWCGKDVAAAVPLPGSKRKEQKKTD